MQSYNEWNSGKLKSTISHTDEHTHNTHTTHTRTHRHKQNTNIHHRHHHQQHHRTYQCATNVCTVYDTINLNVYYTPVYTS